MTYHARVMPDGQVGLPEELALELDLTPGSSLVIEREDGKLVLKSYAQVVKEVQARFRAMLPPGDTGSIVDELIAERRVEAARENAEYDEWLRRQPRK